MKLTPNLIGAAPSFLNPDRDRTILLRGLQIPVIENIGMTRDLNEVIDLTDNDIRVLGNFPKLNRLKTILAAKNRIHIINQTVAESLPNLFSIALNSNNIQELSDLIPLRKCENLNTISLKDNPVTSKPNYRLFTIWSIPSLKILDFEKIKEKERKLATELFGTFNEPTPLASKILGIKSKHFDIYNSVDIKEDKQVELVIKKLTDEDKAILTEELQNATSLAEIDRIETALRNGYM